MLDGILTKLKYARTANTTTHTNEETVKVSDIIDSDSYSDEVSNCCIENSDSVDDDEEMTNFHE